jgi:hypothetical protein
MMLFQTELKARFVGVKPTHVERALASIARSTDKQALAQLRANAVSLGGAAATVVAAIDAKQSPSDDPTISLNVAWLFAR